MKRKLNAGPELILSCVDPICKSIWIIQVRYKENVNYKYDIRSYSRSEGKGFLRLPFFFYAQTLENLAFSKCYTILKTRL